MEKGKMEYSCLRFLSMSGAKGFLVARFSAY